MLLAAGALINAALFLSGVWFAIIAAVVTVKAYGF